LQAKVRERRLGLRPRLCAGCVWDAQRHCHCSMRLLALYKCYAFAVFVLFTGVERDDTRSRSLDLTSYALYSKTGLLSLASSTMTVTSSWPVRAGCPASNAVTRSRCSDLVSRSSAADSVTTTRTCPHKQRSRVLAAAGKKASHISYFNVTVLPMSYAGDQRQIAYYFGTKVMLCDNMVLRTLVFVNRHSVGMVSSQYATHCLWNWVLYVATF